MTLEGPRDSWRPAHDPRLTILRAMGLVAAVAIVLGLFGAFPEQRDAVAVFLLAALVLAVPVHLAIEGNRRDARPKVRPSSYRPTGGRDSYGSARVGGFAP